MPTKNGETTIEMLNADTARKIGVNLSIKSLIELSRTSKGIKSLFQHSLNVQKLLSAVFFGQENVAENIVRAEPILLFTRDTYRTPLLEEDGTRSDESEQVFHNVTPFELMLYIGDFKLWEKIIPLIPQEKAEDALDSMRMITRGGPDLVKMDRDPRTLPFDMLKKFHSGNDPFGNPIVYDLLCNPDGIIYYQGQYFYANQKTETVELLVPTITTSKDGDSFEQLQSYIEGYMVNNSSRRTSNAEHALIQCVFGRTLERNGIHYELNIRWFEFNSDHYQDTYDGYTRTINAYRRYLEQYELPRNHRDAIHAAWLGVCMAQRLTMPFLIHIFCQERRTFQPTPSLSDELKSCPLDRTSNAYNWDTARDEKIFPLINNKGLGYFFGLHKGNKGKAAVCLIRGQYEQWLQDRRKPDLAAICLIKDLSESSLHDCTQAIEQRLRQSNSLK